MASNRILEGYCSHGVKVIRRGMRHLRNGRCVRKGARLRDRRRLRLCPRLRLRLRLRRCRSSLQRRASRPRSGRGRGRWRHRTDCFGRVQADLGGSRAPRLCPTTLAAAAAARAAAARVTRAAVCRRACAVLFAEVESATCRLNEQRQAAGSSNPAWPSPSNPGQPWTWPQPSP
jgi:hypothetical protein